MATPARGARPRRRGRGRGGGLRVDRPGRRPPGSSRSRAARVPRRRTQRSRRRRPSRRPGPRRGPRTVRPSWCARQTSCASHRLDLAALEVRECAKPWGEADADVCEAIDFLEYYARQAIELDRGPELLQVPGERNTMRYVARGVAAVIAPWNFPIAIPCGMTAAALAAGNAVVLKPAEQSPACGYALATALREAGVPPGALSFLPRVRRGGRGARNATPESTRSRSPARVRSGSRSCARPPRRPTTSAT